MKKIIKFFGSVVYYVFVIPIFLVVKIAVANISRSYYGYIHRRGYFF